MRKGLTSLGRTLLLFSLIVTAFLVAAFILYIKFIPAPKLNLPSYLAYVNYEAYSESLLQGVQVISTDTIYEIISKGSIENLYLAAFIRDLPFLLIFILFFFTVSALVLSSILKNQQEAQAIMFAKQLTHINENGEHIPGNPVIAKAYADVKKRIEANVQDYIRLSSYVTHEQKNILSLLRAKLQLSGQTELIEDVDNVVDSLDDILTLSASNKGSDIEIVDAALICANVCDEYKKIYPDLSFDFDDTAHTQIASRELWINRALSNLVDNAMKYSGGKIDISVSNQNGSVIITVSDEGRGINEDELEKLFEYQYRVGKLKKDGYGIGLSLVRHVCDICGGLCHAENRQEKGTMFYMVFPEA